MSPDRTYRWLMEAGAAQAADAASAQVADAASTRDSFDLHVVASILAVAIAQGVEEQRSLALTSGLDADALSELARDLFPQAAIPLAQMAGAEQSAPGPEEQSVIDILLMYASGPIHFVRPLATLIARRCQEPRHLWQDLGLRNRGELSQLMERHFPRLKARNSGDMKWKKFLYRMVCGSEGFALCPAPVCSDCDDFAACFGSEEGVAQLTHAYREQRV